MARINSQHLNQQQQQFAQPPAQMPQTISPSALQVSPQQHQQQPDHAHLSEAQQNMPNLAPPRQSLDASAAAKQIAALSAAARSRVRSHGGPNPYGNPNGSIENSASTPRPATSSGLNNSLLPPLPPTQPAEAPKAQPSSMPFPNPNPRAQAFLKILADFMVNRGTPLPPSLTGVATPSYNPLQSHFRWLEAPGVGVFRLAERLVDLQDLFNVVTKAGGFQKVTHDNTWESLLPAFHLPNQYVPTAAPGGATQSSTPVAPILAKFYSLLLSPFEDWFIKQQQAKMMSARQQQQALGGAGPSQPANPAQGGFPPSAPPSHPPHPLGFPALPQSWPPAGPSAGGMENDMSDEGRKRKEREHEEEMAAGKRLRIDTESSSIHPTHVNGSAASATVRYISDYAPNFVF
jgi:SWI/SNF chromatin-remodeling complex subunit SWI1